MKKLIAGGLAALLLIAVPLANAADVPESWDGLVQIKPKRMDAAYVLPGADFRPYKKLMFDTVEVAFKKDWAKNYNREAATLSQRLTQEDMERISAAARDNFTEVFTEAYKRRRARARDDGGTGCAACPPGRREPLHHRAG